MEKSACQNRSAHISVIEMKQRKIRAWTKDLSSLGIWIRQYIPREQKIDRFCELVGCSVGQLDRLRIARRYSSPKLDLLIDIIIYISQRDNLDPELLALDVLHTQEKYSNYVEQWRKQNAKKEENR